MILQGEIGNSLLALLDDILVFGTDEEEHDENLGRITNLMSQYGLEFNQRKGVI